MSEHSTYLLLPDSYHDVAAEDAWAALCAAQGHCGRTVIVRVCDQEVGSEVAAALQVAPDAMALYSLEHMLLGDDVVQRQETWIPRSLAEPPPSHTLGNVTDEVVSSRMPTAEEVQAFRLDAGVPVLEIHRTTRDHLGRAVEYLRTAAVSGRVSLSYRHAR